MVEKVDRRNRGCGVLGEGAVVLASPERFVVAAGYGDGPLVCPPPRAPALRSEIRVIEQRVGRKIAFGKPPRTEYRDFD